MSDLLQYWISPGLWILFELFWLVPAIMSLRWPGGGGAILFLVGTIVAVFLTVTTSADTYYELLTGDAFLDWNSPILMMIDLAWFFACGLQVTGLSMMILRFRAIIKRLGELESIASHG